MASLIKNTQKLLRRRFSLSGDLTPNLRPTSTGKPSPAVNVPASREPSAIRSHFDSNIIRIIQNEIDFQTEYMPLHQSVASFNSFYIEERPGETFVTLRRKFGEKEDIKIEATMFDSSVSVPISDDIYDGVKIRLHISLLIDIYKGEGSDGLGFVCSAWPDALEIKKVYKLCSNGLPRNALTGPNLRNLDPKLRKGLQEYLEAREVNKDLSSFLHYFMANKGRSELLRWLDSLKSFVEK